MQELSRTSSNVLRRQRSAQAALDEAKRRSATRNSISIEPMSMRRSQDVWEPISCRSVNLVSGNEAAVARPHYWRPSSQSIPIYLNFDMSEGDYLNFQRDRASHRSALADNVDIALSDEHQFVRHGTLNFLDNSLDRRVDDSRPRDCAQFRFALDSGRVWPCTSEPSGFTPSASCSGCRRIGGSDGSRVLVAGADGVLKEKKVQTGVSVTACASFIPD